MHGTRVFSDLVIAPRITKAMGPPKRGLSAYTVFAQELLNTSTFMKDGAPKERIAACGPAWKALSDAEKQPYYAKALVSREQAADAYNEYMAGVDPKLLFQINKQRKAKKLPLYRNHLAPKRPRSSFFRFMDEFRKATPPNSVTEIAKLGGEAWKALSVSDKERYAREYKGEMTTWRLEHPSPAMTKAASATA
ncbi:hypothetical protein B0H10DRAFT_2120708 [Mycena sp. CBHHK59/15]|nr:hypothetical protein B0H10DRAFT_2120708 [Mycena sp. CBHHK59/15]